MDYGSSKSWSFAESYCLSTYGTHLASIHSDTDQTEAYSLMKNNSHNFAWIGFNDIEINGIYEWVDSSSVDYTNWHSTEPQNMANENCTSLYGTYSGNWIDIACNGSNAISSWLCNVNITGIMDVVLVC